jgi:hypothetical protein
MISDSQTGLASADDNGSWLTITHSPSWLSSFLSGPVPGNFSPRRGDGGSDAEHPKSYRDRQKVAIGRIAQIRRGRIMRNTMQVGSTPLRGNPGFEQLLSGQLTSQPHRMLCI